jgi:hypothetical protein
MKSETTVIINADLDVLPSGAASLPSFGGFAQHLLSQLYPSQELPLAQYHVFMVGSMDSACIATPVHVQATHNDAMIISTSDELALNKEENIALYKSLHDFLNKDGFDSFIAGDGSWVFSQQKVKELDALSVFDIKHKSLYPLLPDSEYWRLLFTEIQMLLHQHTVNEKRRALGLKEVNAIWFWGNAQLRPSKATVSVFTQDEALSKFCNHVGLGVFELDKIKQKNTQHNLLLINNKKQLQEIVIDNKKSNWYWNNNAYCMKLPWWKRCFLCTNPKLRRRAKF